MIKTCDLHTHSTFSDGTRTPEGIIEECIKRGISAVALTDHNTISGLERFMKAAEGKDIEAVCGVEISSDDMDRDVHIVGLFIDPAAFSAVSGFLEEANARKTESTKKLIAALSKDGYDISYDEIRKKHVGQINRAVVASHLKEKGYIQEIKDAFRTILSENGGYYTPPKRVTSIEAIEFLSSVGAVSVLAHPYLTFKPDEVEVFLKKAVPHGLLAMETRYSTYSEEISCLATRTAQKYGLLESGGSDDHGENKPHIQLGSGMGSLLVPESFFRHLKTCR